MANKLKINMDQLESTIKTYEKSHQQFEQLVKDLNKSVDNLKNTGWKSSASTAFFNTFDDTWKKNIEKHILIIGHLQDCLENAQREYEEIYNRIPSLKNSL